MKLNGLTLDYTYSTVETFSFDSSIEPVVDKYIKNPVFVCAYLDYCVLIGKCENNELSFFENDSIDSQYIQKIRVFNEYEELYIWKSASRFKGRYRCDVENTDLNEKTPFIQASQLLFGTRSEYINGYTILTEKKRGTTLTVPAKLFADIGDKFTPDKRVAIVTRNYIGYNGQDNSQASYIDSRFVKFEQML